MWRYSPDNDQVDGAAVSKDKIDDSQRDSGFLSSGNLLSSQLSIDSENEELGRDSCKIAPEPAKASESGLDLGLNIDLNNLSLKDAAVDNQLDSGVIDVISEDLISEELDDEDIDDKDIESLNVPQWQLYYALDNDGDTQLHLAIIQEFIEAVYYLIDIAPHSCLLDLQNDNWDTALHLAVMTKQEKIVRKLVLAGANPTVSNYQGDTPLHLACSMGNFSCVKALTCPITQLERSTLGNKRPASVPQNLKLRNYNGQMCIHLATSNGHVDVIRHLVSYGADVDDYEALSGYTSLHLAIGRGLADVAVFLVRDCNAKIDGKSYSGRTAHGLARRSDTKLADELLRLGKKSSNRSIDLSSDSETDDDDDYDDDDEEEDKRDDDKYREVMDKLNISSSSPLVMM